MKRKLKWLALLSASSVLLISALAHSGAEENLRDCNAAAAERLASCRERAYLNFFRDALECKTPIPSMSFMGWLAYDFSSWSDVCVVAYDGLAKAKLESCTGRNVRSLNNCQIYYDIDKKAEKQIENLNPTSSSGYHNVGIFYEAYGNFLTVYPYFAYGNLGTVTIDCVPGFPC